jgi:hypothetical protein
VQVCSKYSFICCLLSWGTSTWIINYRSGYTIQRNIWLYCSFSWKDSLIIHVMKQAGPLKSGIQLLAQSHQRCVLCQRTGLVGIHCHMLKGIKLVQLRGCLQSFLRWIQANMQEDFRHVGSNLNDGFDFHPIWNIWFNHQLQSYSTQIFFWKFLKVPGFKRLSFGSIGGPTMNSAMPPPF